MLSFAIHIISVDWEKNMWDFFLSIFQGQKPMEMASATKSKIGKKWPGPKRVKDFRGSHHLKHLLLGEDSKCLRKKKKTRQTLII